MSITNGAKADKLIMDLLAKMPGLVEAAKTSDEQAALLDQAVRLRGSIGKGRAARRRKGKGPYRKIPNSVLDNPDFA
jgi:hypothetical protein